MAVKCQNQIDEKQSAKRPRSNSAPSSPGKDEHKGDRKRRKSVEGQDEIGEVVSMIEKQSRSRKRLRKKLDRNNPL